MRDAGVATAASVTGSRHSRKKEQAPRRASSQIPSKRSQTPSGAPPSGIEASTGIAQTVAPPPDSRRYIRFAFENKVYQFQVLPFSLNTASQASFGAHSGSLPPSSADIGNPISRRLVNTPPRLLSFITPQVSANKHTEHGRPQDKQSKIRTRTSSGPSVTTGSGESFPPNIQGSGDNRGFRCTSAKRP